MNYSQHDYEVLKKTIYAEARGEPLQGQQAVASVILNRYNANWNGARTIADVCKQPYQFECWNGQSDITIREPEAYASIDRWLPKVLDGSIRDPTGGCDHYNNPAKENADWVRNVRFVKQIGDHHFYKQ